MPRSFTRLWWTEVLRGLLGIAVTLLLVLLQVHLQKVLLILIGFYLIAAHCRPPRSPSAFRRTFKAPSRPGSNRTAGHGKRSA